MRANLLASCSVGALLVTAGLAAAGLFPAFAQTGSSKSTTALSQEINVAFPDNTRGMITPAAARQVTQDIIASYSNSPGMSISVKTFGAKCDGVTDDTAAIQAGINYATGSGLILSLPSGTCGFSAQLTAPIASGWGIVGPSKMVSSLNYTGTATSSDLLVVGGTATPSNHVFLSGFRVTSNTQMTGGAALHLINTGLSIVNDFGADGELGNGNLWHGIWFDGITNGDAILSYDLRGQCDGLRVNNGADLIMTAGGRVRYSGTALTSCAGVHIGGGFGGFQCDTGDIIQNGRNLLIDHAITPIQNREMFMRTGCIIDTASVDDNIQLNDSLENAGTFELDGYISGAQHHGLNIISWPNSNVSIRARIWNNGVGGSGDNVHIADATVAVSFDPSSQIWGLATGDTTGYGINCTSSLTLFGSLIVRSNPTNQNINPNCTFQAFGGLPTGGVLSFSNSSPQLSFSGTDSGQTFSYNFVNNGTATSTSSQFLVATGAAFNFTTIGASIGGVPFSFINSGIGSTGGLAISASTGPVALQTNGINSFASRAPAHWEAGGSSPVLTSCGSSPSIVGTDQSGVITMGSGAPTGCVVTFATSYNATPICNVTWQATPLANQSYTVSNTAITLTQTGTSGNKVVYNCTAQVGG